MGYLTFGNNDNFDYFFSQNPDIAAVLITGAGNSRSVERRFVNLNFFQSNGIEVQRIDLFLTMLFITKGQILRQAQAGEASLVSGGGIFDTPMIALLYPQKLNGADGTGVVLFSAAALTEIFSASGNNTSYMINNSADVLIHPNSDFIKMEANFSDNPFVAELLESPDSGRQKLWTDSDGERYFGAFQKIPHFAGVVVTTIPYNVVFAGILSTINRNAALSAGILIISIVVMLLYSKTISRPLKALTVAAGDIEAGKYVLNLNIKSNDEIGVLADSFTGMGNGLINFEKFTNKTIVRLARQGQLERTGVKKTVTVCFSLIRDFNENCENFKAEEVVSFVNEYLSRLVPCITATGGDVDKFLTQDGVVIMALWGATSSSGYAESDAFACIRTCLMMRAALRCLNEERRDPSSNIAKHVPLIKMGCGINTGEVVSGQMGSDQRMEYTVIGDAVNLAARIEGPNDLFDTDILITENTWQMIGHKLVTEEMESLEVKGKEQPLRVFSVVNSKEPKESEKILEDLKNILKTNSRLCGLCVGQNGPQTMEQVRKCWGK
ncbi:adenylate/guanylate cyclase domain-containing protein [Spirochaetia bacterium]|nr:adenylate/guanylate cyclase domain-containing protein [Spirochaetia bacterium]